MPIAALEPSTIHAIGSSQVLTDSASLVKELVENSLDAQASSIFVDISTNALEVIQVKDNGRGIAPDDRPMVCRRHCTSKIRNLEDLTSIGGTSLGFRGEALASAAEMSGAMLVSTRVDGEAVAVTVRVGRDGSIESEERASHPVGTTVRIVDFLKTLPVRRQTAIKTSSKSLAKIKRALQAYALARPSVRFSLKVLKAKNDKMNWMYAPKTGATVFDAAIKVIDKKTVEQCQWIDWTSGPDSHTEPASAGVNGQNSVHDSIYSVEALLPTPQCDISTISNSGQYISIDSRPVACTRGTLKQIISLFKSYLRSARSLNNGEKLVDPFLCMNIVCPPSSYDANVEPAKDDVLFIDADIFIRTIEQFFKSVYGALLVVKSTVDQVRQSAPKSRAFDLLLARKPPPTEDRDDPNRCCNEQGKQDDGSTAMRSPPVIGNVTIATLGDVPHTEEQTSQLRSLPSEMMSRNEESPERLAALKLLPGIGDSSMNDEPPIKKRRTWQRNMYEEDEEEMTYSNAENGELEDLTLGGEIDERDALRDIAVSNPWTFAKMNTSVRPARVQRDLDTSKSFENNGQLLTPSRQNGERLNGLNSAQRQHTEDFQRGLPTPNRSRLLPSSVLEPQSSPSERFPFPSRAWGKGDREAISRKQKEQARDLQGHGALDTWVQKSVDDEIRFPRPVSDSDDQTLANNGILPSTRSNDFISARNLPTGTPLSAIPSVPQRPNRKPIQRKQHHQSISNPPFISPIHDPSRVWFEIEPRPKAALSHQEVLSQTVRKSIAATAPLPFASEDEDSVLDSSPEKHPQAQPTHPDLETTMDYEHRKKVAVQNRKDFLRRQQKAQSISPAQDPAPSTPPKTTTATSPHKNRYHAALAALSPHLDPADPRSHLLHPKRRKTALLPLESTPQDEFLTRNLTLPLSTPPSSALKATVVALCRHDAYVADGEIRGAFEREIMRAEVGVLEVRVRGLVERGFEREGGGRVVGFKVNLGGVFEGGEGMGLGGVEE